VVSSPYLRHRQGSCRAVGPDHRCGHSPPHQVCAYRPPPRGRLRYRQSPIGQLHRQGGRFRSLSSACRPVLLTPPVLGRAWPRLLCHALAGPRQTSGTLARARAPIASHADYSHPPSPHHPRATSCAVPELAQITGWRSVRPSLAARALLAAHLSHPPPHTTRAAGVVCAPTPRRGNPPHGGFSSYTRDPRNHSTGGTRALPRPPAYTFFPTSTPTTTMIRRRCSSSAVYLRGPVSRPCFKPSQHHETPPERQANASRPPTSHAHGAARLTHRTRRRVPPPATPAA